LMHWTHIFMLTFTRCPMGEYTDYLTQWRYCGRDILVQMIT
jgi:hypothetical protein